MQSYITQKLHGMFSEVDDVTEDIERIAVGKGDLVKHRIILVKTSVQIGHDVGHK